MAAPGHGDGGAGAAGDTLPEHLQLAVDLINVESLSGYEQPMADFLETWLRSRGWVVQRQQVPPQAHGGDQPRDNIYARRPECTAPTGPRVLFNSHIDTVPPYIPARVERSAGGDVVIWGRGACDTKGILAAQLTALQQLVDGGCTDLGLLYVVSEETDHSGMLSSNELGLDPEYLVVGEPTGSKMMRLQKGMLKARLVSKGTACHSGYPELGKSAIDPLVAVLRQLQETQWPGSEELGATTLNVGLISGGQAANALAEHAEATLMFRLTDQPDVVLQMLAGMLEGTGISMQVITSNSPVKLSVLPDFETDIAAYNTDIAYFKFSGKALLYGPGSIHHAHSRTEHIRGSEITAAIGAYRRIASLALGLQNGAA